MTNRAFVSLIQNSIKALGINDWVAPRQIISKAKEITSHFLAQTNNSSRLIYKNNTIFSEIEGLKMERVDSTTCDLSVYECNHLMKSIYPLPQIYNSKFGPIIPEVMSVNFGQEYKPIFTPKQWKATQKREFQDHNIRYYFFIQDFLYIPVIKASEPSPEEIRILALFKDKYDVYKYRQLVGACEDCNKANPCAKLLDFEIVIPDYLIDDVIGKLLQDLANIYLKVIPSEAENLNPNDKNSQRDLQNRKIQS